MLNQKEVDKLRKAIISYIRRSTKMNDLDFINLVHTAAFWARGEIKEKINKINQNQNEKR